MKKIHFSNKFRLTQAVLERLKNMTRRKIPQKELNKVFSFRETYYDNTFDYLSDKELFEHFYFTEKLGKLPYKVGEVVAIAQSYRSITEEEEEINGVLGLYRIGQKYLTMDEMGAGWSNKMFTRADLMPHHIRITSVKVERLQDISDADCLREGIRQSVIEYERKKVVQYTYFGEKRTIWYDTPREAFAALIDRISGKGTWDSNPWVFAYEFELID